MSRQIDLANLTKKDLEWLQANGRTAEIQKAKELAAAKKVETQEKQAENVETQDKTAEKPDSPDPTDKPVNPDPAEQK